MVVPCRPALGFGSALWPGFGLMSLPSAKWASQAQLDSFVLVVTLRWAMWLILASASPRKPYVPIEVRSSKALSLEVVKRSHKIGKSSFWDS